MSVEAAFDTVETMFEAGYWDFRRMMGDDDLALVNATDRFRTMVRAAWSKQYIGMLERDTRDAMQHPDEIMLVHRHCPSSRHPVGQRAARLAVAWFGLHLGPYPYPQLTVVSPPPGAGGAASAARRP